MIKLELRGKIFIVDKDVLLKVKGTYFYGLLSSGAWQPNSAGVYVIDRYHEGFDRLLDCLSTGKLNCGGLTEYEIECVYDNLDYFLVPFIRVWDYSKVFPRKDFHLQVYLQLKDGRLCGTRFDSISIYIYNMDTNRFENTMQGHSNNIKVIVQLQDGRICSCSHDKTIKVWNIESGECDRTIVGHNFSFNYLIQLIDGRLCTVSDDRAIRVWNTASGACELTIRDGCYIGYIVQLRDGCLCSGYNKGEIKIWNLTTGVCEMTLGAAISTATPIRVIDDSRICSCSDKVIKIWNIGSGVCERTLEGHTDYVGDMVLLFDGRICSASWDKTVRIWNIESGVCEIDTYIDGMETCKVVHLNDDRLIVSIYSGTGFLIGG